MKSNAIGLIGGTFDPIHEGHLAIAKKVCDTLQLSHVEFIPSYQPPHRDTPIGSPENRLFMVTLAIKPYSNFIANDIEIRAKKISYTIDTLRALRKQNPTTPFCFIIGEDAFSQFDSWHDYAEILTLTHLVVVTRSEQKIPYSKKIETILSVNEIKNPIELHQAPAGKIYLLQINPITISATKIRQALRAHENNIVGLPASVEKYITEKKLYQE